jgi:probable F420-dependent oxidoreductase
MTRTSPEAVDAVRARLGRVGTWVSALSQLPAAAAREAAAEIEELGYGSVWIGESPLTKEPFTSAAILLHATRTLPVGTGIANVWSRDPATMNAAAQTLGEAFPGRFLLGLGVSHAPTVTRQGHSYERPLAKMTSYVEQMETANYAPAPPAEPVPWVLAALRTKMLELARDRTDGVHPYFVPTSHTARAREVLGPGPLLIPEQAVLVETDPTRARELAREHASFYLTLPNYVNNLRALGFTDEDCANGGSDRLVDAIVAWGDVDAIKARIDEHLAAGADHVVVQPLAPNRALDLGQLRELAPALQG